MNEFSIGNSLRTLVLTGSLFLSFAAAAQPLSGNYTINALLPSSSNNFTSFNNAVTALTTNGINAPVVFEVASGTYNEQVIIPAITGASQTKTITFDANEAILTYNSMNPDERAVLKLNGADNITIRGLAIIATGSTASEYGYGIQMMNGANRNHIENCTITVSQSSSSSIVHNYAGILINNWADNITMPGNTHCNLNVIEHNTISGGYHGIALVANGSDESEMMSRNQIVDNVILDFFNAGIYLNGNDQTLIAGNDISRPNRSTAALFYGIQLYDVNTNMVVSKNKIHNPFGGTASYVTSGANGIYCVDVNASEGKENIFSNNIIYNLKCGSIIRGIWLGNSSSSSAGNNYNKFLNNTLSLDDEGFTGISNTTGFEVSGTSGNLTVQNNIVSIKRVGMSFNTRYGISLGNTDNITVDHNSVYIAAGSTNYFGKWGSTNCATLANWASNTGDVTSLSEDPQFIDALTGNLLPTNNALQSGAAITITGIDRDITDLGRNNIPTIGAFEMDGVVLPVKMSLLTGKSNKENYAVLSWNTFSETNNKGFRIQRSNNGEYWDNAGFVYTKAPGGNSMENITYTYKDVVTITGRTFYRLQQLDADGKTTYSNIITLDPTKGTGQEALSVYPNPATTGIQFMLPGSVPLSGWLTITDQTGKVIYHAILDGTDNRLDISSYAPGLYFVKLVDGRQVLDTKFIKVN